MTIGRRSDIADLAAPNGEGRAHGGPFRAQDLSTIVLFSALRSKDIGPGELIRELDEFLRLQAARTGEAAFVRAANALHHQNSGRPSLDDQKLIGEALWLVEHGKAKTLNQALQRVARTHVDEDRVKAVAERLRRKIALQRKD